MKRNPSVFCGCPCHIIHNAAQKAGETFTQSYGFDVEEFTIDLFKVNQKKEWTFKLLWVFDQEYKKVIQHVLT